jgi:hypothetical protein
MSINHKQLLSLILEMRMDYKRINDVSMDNSVYTISSFDVKTGDVVDQRWCLKDGKSNEYALSVRQLAGLRVATGAVKAEWLDEFRTDPNGVIFQVKAREMSDAGVDISTIKFKVVKQLKVKNNMITHSVVPVYKDFCYEGALEYTRGVRALISGKGTDFYKQPEYSRGMADLRERLHQTALRPDKAIEANLVLLPIFEVS